MEKEHRISIFFSGNGSTAEAVADACHQKKFPNTEVVCAITNNPKAPGINKLKRFEIPVSVLEKSSDFDQQIIQIVSMYRSNTCLLLGYLQKISPRIINFFDKNIYNQHPAPPSEFGGLGMYGIRVFEAIKRYYTFTGETKPYNFIVAQRVDKDYDQGAVVKYQRVNFSPDLNSLEIQQLTLPQEHQLILSLIKDIDGDNVQEVSVPKIVKPEHQNLLEQIKQSVIQEMSQKK